MRAWWTLTATWFLCAAAWGQTSGTGERSTPDLRSSEAPEAAQLHATAQPHVEGLVRPYSAVLRSAVVPGWGQFAIRQPIQGSIFAASSLGLLTGWWLVRQDYTAMYADEYLPAVDNYGVDSAEADAIYLNVNKRFKVGRFLLFTAAGIWAFSLIDAYVDASIYNAELRSADVLKEAKTIRLLQFGLALEQPGVRVAFAF